MPRIRPQRPRFVPCIVHRAASIIHLHKQRCFRSALLVCRVSLGAWTQQRPATIYGTRFLPKKFSHPKARNLMLAFRIPYFLSSPRAHSRSCWLMAVFSRFQFLPFGSTVRAACIQCAHMNIQIHICISSFITWHAHCEFVSRPSRKWSAKSKPHTQMFCCSRHVPLLLKHHPPTLTPQKALFYGKKWLQKTRMDIKEKHPPG